MGTGGKDIVYFTANLFPASYFQKTSGSAQTRSRDFEKYFHS
jgi:hypothetical protein